MKAAVKYDSSKSKFSSYSAWWIKQAIIRIIHDKSRAIRLPVQKSTAVIKFKGNSLSTGKNGTLLSPEEVSEWINLPYEEIKRLLALEEITSLESLTVGDSTLSDSIRDTRENHEEGVLYEMFRKNLSSILHSALDDRELDIIKRRFGLEGYPKQTLEEVSKEYGLSREGIRQIEEKARKKLGNNLEMKGLLFYLGDKIY